ncbi:alpha/beta fold hydrolase [Cellulomonas sp. C5510]|uniref:alpha/beta fold hydrolase n=1 Tax=Cellulomonas sp. C5510 TaxID=2871170 RepID=UPI001C95EA2E|nr:alpha/beta fold hydrolase [Cellulomonas sp. C5510]QZN85099.1 alpha/beta fold hydrolase [Cellulomonas sp. C5510]
MSSSPHPIVLVHGTRTSSAIWEDQVRALTHGGHATVAIDLPGHGSRSSERFTFEGGLAAIDEAVRSCDSPPLLVGLSLGGYMALAYAGEHEDRLAGVVLAGCSTDLKGKPLRAYRRASRRLVPALGLGGGTWHVVTDMLAALQGYSPLRDLRRLVLPVWLVNGARDPLRFGARRYLGAHPGARQWVVPGAGHDVNSHAPVAFNRILLHVLRDLAQRMPLPAPRLG